MKKTLLILSMVFAISYSYGQNVINLTASDNIQATIDGLPTTLIEPVIINLAAGALYNENVNIIDAIITSPANTLTIQSEDSLNPATIMSLGGNTVSIRNSYIRIENLIIMSDEGNSIFIEEGFQGTGPLNDVIITGCKLEGAEGSNNTVLNLIIMTTPMYGYENIFIINNEILNGKKGISIDNGYSSDMIKGVHIIDNNIRNQKEYSIYLNLIKNVQVLHNNIDLPLNNIVSDKATGIFLNNISTDAGMNSVVNANTITNTIDTIEYNGISINDCDTSLLVTNNFIEINTDEKVYGIFCNYSTSRLINNTVNLTGVDGTALHITKSGNKPELKNNIFVSENIALFCEMMPPTNSNYNCFYAGSNPPFNINFGDVSLADWQATYTSIDQNSIDQNPMFTTGSAFYTNQALDNIANTISEVSNDLNGVLRNTVGTCDIGAIEQAFIDLGEDQMLCDGDTIFLDLLPPYDISYSIEWSNGFIGANLEITETGTYSVIVQEYEFGPIASDDITINQAPYSTFMGTVSHSGGNFGLDEIKIEVYVSHEQNAYHIEKVAEAYTDVSGMYEILNIEPGTYKVRAVLVNGDYPDITSCYYNSIETTVNWDDADSIILGCEEYFDISFVMFEIPEFSTSGNGIFEGVIEYVSGDKSTLGQPVTGAEVYIEQEPNDEPIARSTSNTEGEWNIPNIPVGTGYKIKVDIPGLDLLSTYTNIEISTTDINHAGLNFIVDTASTSGGIFTDTATAIVELDNEFISLIVYPNPVVDFINIETEITTNANISVNIVAIDGKKVYSSIEETNYRGIYNKKVNLSELENGTYILKVKINNNYFIKKIIKE